MFPSPYELYLHVQEKGYIPPMAGQITLDSLSKAKPGEGGATEKFVGTGEHLKVVMEIDRRSVYKFFFGEEPTESTWVAGEEPGKGMVMPKWAERLIHAEVMVTKEKIDSSMDYLLHELSKIQSEKSVVDSGA